MEKRTVIKLITTAFLTFLGIFLFFKYLFSLFLPFIIAFCIAFLLNFPVKLLKKRVKLSSRVLSGLLVATVVGFIGFVSFLAISRIITELERLILSLNQNSDKIVADFFNVINGIAKHIPFIDLTEASLSSAVADAVKGIITEATSHLPSFITAVISMLPSILLFTVVLILASYYFSADFDGIKACILSFLPNKAKSCLKTFKKRLADTGLKYFKASLILLFITYFELLVGFLMLKIPYAFILSLAVATVDMLPIFGVGTVLVPWAIWKQLTGDTYTAVGLIIIFAVITVARQFIEPKIISSGIGISPITTLFSMYAGFKLFGLGGLIFAPITVVLILHALPENIAKKLGLRVTDGQYLDKKEKE